MAFINRKHTPETITKMKEAKKIKPPFLKGKKMPKEWRENLIKNHPRGENHPRWKGGRRRNTSGYVRVLSPNHPNASSKYREVYEHRLVMEKHLGRYLKSNEIVHHVNNIHYDNRIENLILMTQSEHLSTHNKNRVYRKGIYKNGNTKSKRKCFRCKKTLPLTPASFHRNKCLPLGFSYMCKPCDKERRRLANH